MASLKESFQKVLDAEQRLREAEGALRDATIPLQVEVAIAEKEIEARWIEVRDALAGKKEGYVAGEHTDCHIYYSTPRQLVNVPDENAVPDEFTKKTPEKRKIGDFMKEREARGLPLPNWCGWKLGESKLVWKPIKRKGETV